jgi:hypothetical protein
MLGFEEERLEQGSHPSALRSTSRDQASSATAQAAYDGSRCTIVELKVKSGKRLRRVVDFTLLSTTIFVPSLTP